MISVFTQAASRYIMGLRAIVFAAGLTVMPNAPVSAANAAVAHAPPRPVPMISNGSCSFKKTEYAAASSYEESASEDFINLRDAGSITFTQSGTGCVAGTFFANGGNSGAGDHVGLQVLLDGAPCAPLTNGYIFADNEASSHSVAFFCGARIAPGRHTIQVQYHSGFGGTVQFFQRTLEVNHG